MSNIRSSFDKLNKMWVWVLLIFITAFGLRFYYAVDKDYNFWDEDSAIIISGPSFKQWKYQSQLDQSFPKDKVYLGKEVWKDFYPTDNSISGVCADLKRLHFDNYDTSHTNFYYILLRISFLGLDTDHSVDYIHRGLILNFILFAIGFVLMYKLASMLFKDKVLICCVLSLSFFSAASVGNTLFLRPYQMQELFFILLTIVFVYLFCAIVNSEKIISVKNVLLLALVASLTAMTGYFSIPYILLIGGVLALLSLKFKQPKNLLFLAAILVLGYGFCLLLYRGYNNGFTDYHAVKALSKIDGEDTGNLENSIVNLPVVLSAYLGKFFIITTILVVAYALLRNKMSALKMKSKEKWIFYIPVVIFVMGLVWTLSVFYLASYKLIRYVVAILPMMMLIVAFVLSSYSKKWIRVALTAILAILSMYHTLSMSDSQMYWTRFNLPSEYKDNVDIPLVVLNSYDFAYASQLPLMSDDRQIEFVTTEDDFLSKFENHNTVFAYYPFTIQLHGLDKEKFEKTFVCGTYMMEDYQLVRIDKIPQQPKLETDSVR